MLITVKKECHHARIIKAWQRYSMKATIMKKLTSLRYLSDQKNPYQLSSWIPTMTRRYLVVLFASLMATVIALNFAGLEPILTRPLQLAWHRRENAKSKWIIPSLRTVESHQTTKNWLLRIWPTENSHSVSSTYCRGLKRQRILQNLSVLWTA